MLFDHPTAGRLFRPKAVFPALFPLFLVLTLLTGCGGPAEPVQEDDPLVDCLLDGDLRARCGVVMVPENHDEPTAERQIPLHFAVLPATSNQQAAEPVVMLAGGPGQAGLEAFPLLVPLLADLRETHEIILLDQRGTGASGPLACPQVDALDDETATDEDLREALADCGRMLAAERDMLRYTTREAAADLAFLAESLGYEQLHLYGISYGSRLAQSFARAYPERVKSLVLDAVVGPELILNLQQPRDGQRALDLLIERCAADEACRTEFPNFGANVTAAFAGVAEPRPVTFPDPFTGEERQVDLDQDLLSQMVFGALYSPEIAGLLPLFVEQAAVDGEYGPLLAQAYIFGSAAGINLPLFYAVICTEDAPLIDLDAAQALRDQSTDLFALTADDTLAICDRWPSGEPPAGLREPLTLDVPVLLLSGEADPITPPLYAENVAAALPDSLHVIFPLGGHGALTNRCAADIVTAFVQAGSLADLDTACAGRYAPPPFFVDPNGPRP